MSIDRDALLAVVRANVNRLQDGRVISDAEFVDRILALVRPAESPSAREIADWFEREADPNIPDDWRLRTARTIRREWGLS